MRRFFYSAELWECELVADFCGKTRDARDIFCTCYRSATFSPLLRLLGLEAEQYLPRTSRHLGIQLQNGDILRVTLYSCAAHDFKARSVLATELVSGALTMEFRSPHAEGPPSVSG